MSPLEIIAVLLALLYVLLAVKEHRICWVVAAASASLYTWIFWEAALIMEAALQLFYIVIAIYGWLSWGEDNGANERPIRTWSWRQHLIAILTVLVISSVTGALLNHFTDAALPWLDSFTTIAALLTTWMVTQKILENWLYWIAIDAISIYLYLSRDLQLTAGLFVVYIGLAYAGWRVWRTHYRSTELGHTGTLA